MNKIRYSMLSIILMLIFLPLLGEVNLTLSNQIPFFNYFPAASLDPANPQSQVRLFQLSFLSDEDLNSNEFYGKLEIKWNGTDLLTGQDQVISPRFNLISGITQSFWSNDILNDGSEYFSSSIDFDTIKNSVNEFEDILLETGRFPDGSYEFSLQLFNEEDEPISNKISYRLTIMSPTETTLIAPGAQEGSSNISVFNEYPTFVWLSNMNEFDFYLYELESENTENINPDMAFFSTHITGTTTFRYPDNAPLLETNKIYGWQLITNITGATDNITEESPIYIFKITEPTESSNPNTQIFDNFIQALGLENVEAISNLINQGYVPSGNISFQGEEINIDELVELLIEIQNGNLRVKSLSVE